jgi:hypothetical protein
MLLQKITVDQGIEVASGPSRWVLWLWAGAMIVSGAFYAVVGGGMLQLPILTSYSVEAYYAPLMLFWALTGIGEIVDATVNRRRGWGARLASSLVTTIVFTGFGVILVGILVDLVQAGWSGKVVDPFVAPVIVAIVVIMVLAPLPAAVVNWYQAVACHDDTRRTNMLLAVAAIHCLPLLWAIILVAAPGNETIDIRVVAGGVVAIGFVLARLLRAEGRERVSGRRRHGSH